MLVVVVVVVVLLLFVRFGGDRTKPETSYRELAIPSKSDVIAHFTFFLTRCDRETEVGTILSVRHTSPCPTLSHRVPPCPSVSH